MPGEDDEVANAETGEEVRLDEQRRGGVPRRSTRLIPFRAPPPCLFAPPCACQRRCNHVCSPSHRVIIRPRERSLSLSLTCPSPPQQLQEEEPAEDEPALKLFEASRNGDTAVAARLIDEGADIHATHNPVRRPRLVLLPLRPRPIAFGLCLGRRRSRPLAPLRPIACGHRAS